MLPDAGFSSRGRSKEGAWVSEGHPQCHVQGGTTDSAPQLRQHVGLDRASEASKAPPDPGWGVWFWAVRGLVLASVYAQTLMLLGQCFAFRF